MWSPSGGALILPDAKPVRLAAGAFLLLVRVVAGFAPCRVAIRQPSNAPPLLLSPAGLATRRGPHTKTHLGLCPKTPLTLKLRLDTNWTFQQMLKSRSVRRRRYALKVPAAHFMWKLWMVRGRGGWGAGRRLAEGAVLQTIKYLLNCHLSSPPQRRGQGWWFALPRSSAGR